MIFVCLSSPAWPTGAAPPAELAEALLAEVPRVAAGARGILWADARGLPAPRIALALLGRLRAMGVGDARAGISAVPVAAELAARGGSELVTVVEPGREREFLAPLALGLLGADARLHSLLDGVGILTCGQLAALEREAVEARFGGAGAALRRLARADDARRIFQPVPRERPAASIEFLDYAISDAARLVFTANALLGSVCDTLRERGERAQAMTLSFELSGGGTDERTLRCARPTGERAPWLRRLQGALERWTLSDSVTGVTLAVEGTTPVSATQGDIFDRGFASAGAAAEAVARLIDEWDAPLVEPAVESHPLIERRTRWQPLEPERLVTDSGGIGAPTAASAAPAAAASPSPCLTLQLLPEPRRIEVRVRPRRDHHLPTGFLDPANSREWQTIVTAAGPDRVSGGQWDAAYAREYFRCTTGSGRLVWLFRDAIDDVWFLQGGWG